MPQISLYCLYRATYRKEAYPVPRPKKCRRVCDYLQTLTFLPEDHKNREQADIPVKQAVEGDLPSLVGEDVGAKLTMPDQKQTRTIQVSVMKNSPLLYSTADRAAFKLLLLYGSHFLPNRKKILKLHCAPPLLQSYSV